MKIRLWTLIFILLVQIAFYEEKESGREPQRENPFSYAPDPNPRRPQADPFTVEIQTESPKSSSTTGTAFSFDGSGRWMTARHVVDNCSQLYISTEEGLFSRGRKHVRIAGQKPIAVTEAKVESIAPNADLAVIRSGQPMKQYLQLAEIAPYEDEKGQRGYAVGFPEAKPGEVAANLIGRAMAVMHFGRDDIRQSLLVWSVDEFHISGDKLSGISGGPIINEKGEAVGANTAANERRGRLLTSAPYQLRQLADSLPGTGAYKPDGEITRSNYVSVADTLRDRHAVAQVFCMRK